MDFGRTFLSFVILTCISSVNVVNAEEMRNKIGKVNVVKYCEIHGKTIGPCVGLLNCQPVLDALKTSVLKGEVIKDRLSSYFCGSGQQKYAEICCPNKEEIVKTLDRFTGLDVPDHPNIKLIPSQICGPPPNSKFYRGGYADITDYPWTALLKYENTGPQYLCGGSLINNRYILTSAQCIKNKFKLIGVRLGEYDTTSEIDCVKILNKKYCKDPPQDFTVSSEDATIHPQFNETTLENDIALIRLKKEVKFTDFVVPICLPIMQSTPLYDSGVYAVVGWGATKTGLSSEILKFSDVVKLNDTACAQYLRNGTKLKTKDRQICTNTLNENRVYPCIGDQGGALINAVEDDIRDVQYGIVSVKPAECSSSTPMVYTKVTPYVNWILDTIKP